MKGSARPNLLVTGLTVGVGQMIDPHIAGAR